MTFTRWITPGRVFIVVLLCCFVVAHAAELQERVDSRFDAGSAGMALRWQHLKGSLPHDKIPDTPEKIRDVGSWGKPYAIGLVKLVGPGFAIALLSLVGGLLYGLFKVLRACICGLCKKKDEEDGDIESESYEEEEETNKSFKRVWCPTIVYAVCWVFVLTGMIFGLMNNPRFSDGVDDMSTSVINVGGSAVDLGNGLLSNVTSIVGLIPVTIDGLEAQFSGVDPLADEVTVLAGDINATSSTIGTITNEIGVIDAGNISVIANLYAQLATINNQSELILSQMSSLTDQVANKLHSTLNSTLGTLHSKVDDIDSTVDGLESTAKGLISQATKLVKEVISKVNDAKSYDASRGKAVLALFALVIVVTFAIAIGYCLRYKFIFNLVAAFSFVFMFLLWFSGSIHFVLGMALYDACPVIDVTVQGLLPTGTAAANVLQGCLYDHRTVLESMNITAYNLTEVFDYKSEFANFANFSQNFNFSSVDSYFNSIDGLYQYNLTAIADNITVANFGWNQSVIYTALDKLNNNTYPEYYDLGNYTDANPNNYSPPKNQTVYENIKVITNLLEVNQTIYNKTAMARQELYAAQIDINALLSNMTALHQRFDDIKGQVTVLQTKNITNCIAILDNLQGNITSFFELGNCSFLGDSYVEIRTSLCETMQPAIDCLTVAQFIAGLALIPIAILAEVLSFRVPKNKRVAPCGGDDYDAEEAGKESYGKDKGGYAIAMTDSPIAKRRRSTGFTATVSTAHSHYVSSAESTPTSTPDFNAGRKNQVHAEAPHQVTQNYVLPPIVRKNRPPN